MRSSLNLVFLFAFALVIGAFASGAKDLPFNVNYHILFGNEHVVSFNRGRELQISMDKTSGSGFGSKANYGSGFFHMRIKLPDRDSAGVVTAFYLRSKTNRNNHDEVDIEFLGNREGKPYTLQTNVFANGQGNREQRMHLWFDPTADFHNYKFLWNEHQIVFFVDNIPIRVFKNKANIGVSYPSKPMQILATIWDGDNWATDGGLTKTNWSFAPFKSHFQDFNIIGCPISSINTNCNSPNFWWNQRKYWKLSSKQRKKYEEVRAKYMTYDYCVDKSRFSTPPPECFS